MTARLIAERMSFVGWLHTAVRKDSRALALFADAEDLTDEAGDGTIAACSSEFPGIPGPLAGPPAWRNARISSRVGHPEPTPHTTLTTCCKPRRHLRTSRTPSG